MCIRDSLRRRRDRRHGLDPRLDPHRHRPRPDRGPDQGLLSRGVEHRRVRDHGDRADGPPGGPVRQGSVMAETSQTSKLARLGPLVGLLLLVAAPFIGLYPVFVMTALCYAIFACAFNLLLGYTGLLSFGHAAYFATAAYVTGWVVRSEGW